jgi:hypothetical protein
MGLPGQRARRNIDQLLAAAAWSLQDSDQFDQQMPPLETQGCVTAKSTPYKSWKNP